MMKRRLLALALALCMALSLVPAALAANTDTNTLYYKTIWSPEETFRDPLVFEPNLSYSYRFFTDEACENEVTKNLIFTADEDSPADAVIPTRGTDRDRNGNEVAVWYLYAKRLGTGTISYTDGSTTYTLAVSCVLPTRAFTTEPAITETSILRSGSGTFLPNTPFYYVFPAGTVITSAELDEEAYAYNNMTAEVDATLTILPDKPNVCEITVSRVRSVQQTYRFFLTFTLAGWDHPTWNAISLRDATPRLGVRDVRWTNGELDGYYDYFYTNLDLELGNTALVGFFYGNTQDNTLLNITSAAFYTNDGELSDALTAEKRDDGSWCLNADALTEGILLCAASSGDTYALPVTVSLPRLGFYTSQTRSGDACIPESLYYNAAAVNTFWLICENGFTDENIANAEVTCEYSSRSGRVTSQASDYFTWEAVARPDNADLYDLKFTVKPGVTLPAKALELCVRVVPFGSAYLTLTTEVTKPDSSALSVNIDGKDYVVGFGYDQGDAITINTDGGWSQGYTLPAETDDDASILYHSGYPKKSWGILAASGTSASYVSAPEIQEQITVKRVWLERRSGSSGEDGNTNTFSFSQTERLLSLTENLPTDGFPIYVADETGEVYLCAEISVGGTSGTIYTCLYHRREAVTNETFKTVEEINNWLNSHADAIYNAAMDEEADTTWNLNLTADSYSGTITIPEKLGNTSGRSLGIAIWGNHSTLNGSINLNGAKIDTISHLRFTSQNREGIAIQNGASVVDGCTFEGYETALSGALFPHNCTFKNNTTALVLELANTRLRSDMYNCLFEKNDTAVRVKSITLDSAFLSPYHLRLHDSAFLNNTTDFNVQTEGTFYFLRNYFADSGSPARAANTLTPNGATVYVNPIWKYRDADTGALRELTLVEGEDTRLPVNEDWSNTSIAADSLTSQTQIALADENDNTVATWSDFREQAPAQQSRFALYSADETGTDTTPDGFRPGVSIDTQPTGEQTVTVADSAALAEKTPLLTIPCALKSAVVRLNGKPVASKLEEDGKLSFRVAAGGTYTVRPGTSEKYEDGTITIENAPENAATAIAALYDAKGRFLTAATAQIDANGAAAIPLKKPDLATCRIYYLTANNTPAN